MKIVNQFCEDEKSYENISKLYPDDEFDGGDVTIYQTIESVALDVNDTFVMCKFFDKETNCEELFIRLISEKGPCFSFNALNIQDFLTNE